MRKVMLLCAAVVAVVPAGVRAQGFGVGARVGLVGIGAEAAVGVASRVAVRGGVGLLPFETTTTIDDITYTLELPRTWYNVGVDFFLGGPFRLGGGVLFKPDDPTLEATPTANVDVGGQTFTPEQIGTLRGTFVSRDRAPYAMVGLGRHTTRGFGLFLDAGVALLGEPEVTLESVGGTFSDQEELNARLAAEADQVERDSGDYLRAWPFLSVGVKLGIG